MLASYRAAYAAEGALAFSLSAFIARFSIAVYPIGLVLIVSARAGDYGFAGFVSGALVLGEAAGNPLGGSLVDRYGQRRVIRPFLLAHLVTTAVFATLVLTRAPLWTLPLPALLMGATLLNVGALVRARWSYVWSQDPDRRSTAYSIESVLDEVIFVLGPLVAAVLAAHVAASATLGLAAALVVAGSLRLATLVDTDPPGRAAATAGTDPAPHRFALRYPGMALTAAVMVFIGGVFGSAEVTFVAFCGQHGDRTRAGLVLACFAGGSALAGIAYGARSFTLPARDRLLRCSVVFLLLTLILPWPNSVWLLAICAGIVGLGIAPTLISGFGLVDEIVPAAGLTAGLTWIGTGLSVGYGLGASAVGGIADAHGARLAFAVPISSAAAAVLVATVLRFRRAEPASKQPAVSTV